jgi:hypothetical protein
VLDDLINLHQRWDIHTTTIKAIINIIPKA